MRCTLFVCNPQAGTGDRKPIVILLGLNLIRISTIGLAALANSLGQRIQKANPSSNSKFTGAIFLVVSGLALFLGWFIVTPIALCIGFGSNIQTLFQHTRIRK
jgi:hypothetical protein